jgi:hypothetical protein
MPAEIGQLSRPRSHHRYFRVAFSLGNEYEQAREHVSGGADDETRQLQERSAITSCR